MRSGT